MQQNNSIDSFEDAEVVLFEPSTNARARMVRAAIVGSNLKKVALCGDIIDLSDHLTENTRVLCINAAEMELGLTLLEGYPQCNLIVWSDKIGTDKILPFRAFKGYRGILAWPSSASNPRLWELRYLIDSILSIESKGIAEYCISAGHARFQWKPQKTSDRDSIVQKIKNINDQLQLPSRLSRAIQEAGYELIMNAMYDAPVDINGIPKYAFNRRKDIALKSSEIPTVRLLTDGNFLAIEVTDPFGGLEEHHIVSGIQRGMQANTKGTKAGAVLDTSHGGAGLGLWRCYQHSSVFSIQVTRRKMTRTTVIFDLSLKQRVQRSQPTSLHILSNE